MTTTNTIANETAAERVCHYAPKDGGMFGYSRKQAGVIYAATKRGDVTLTREQTGLLYDCADSCVCGTTDADTQNFNYCIKAAVEAIFSKDYEVAQNLLNEALAA